MAAEWKRDLATRATGLVVICLGGLMLKLGFFDVLHDAEAHASSVSSSLTLHIFGSMLILLGLVMLALGASAAGPGGKVGRLVRDADGKPIKVRQWIAVIVLTLPGVLLYAWLKIRLGELGFK